MKIKIIDLLNKIANDEEVPKKIKINNVIYEYRGYMYCTEKANYQDIENYLFGKWNFNILNDYAEIIEEPKEIEYPILHKTAPSEATGDQMPNWRKLIDVNFEHLNKTIYQLIDEVNKLNEKMLMAYDSEKVVESKE